MTILRLSMVQMTSDVTHSVNIAAVTDAATRAAHEGAELLALPEMSGMMNLDRAAARPQVTDPEHDPFIAACREMAVTHGLWIHCGSTPVRAPRGDKWLNHSTLIDPTGKIAARYDKIHLFDVDLKEEGRIGESDQYAPGNMATLVDTPWGPWGLSICYDLRFAHLYRGYAVAGARILFIPAAFTVPTGRAHWNILLRARAIENGAFVVAPAQVGKHADGRQTWGHSMVVSPWGDVLADLGGDGPGQITLDLNLDLVDDARGQVPSLKNGRDFTLDRVDATRG